MTPRALKVASWLPLFVVGIAVLLVGSSNRPQRHRATKETEQAEGRELAPLMSEIEGTWAIWDAEDKLAEARENAGIGQAADEAGINRATDAAISRSLARIEVRAAKEASLRATLAERYGQEPVQRAEAKIRERRRKLDSEELRKRYQE